MVGGSATNCNRSGYVTGDQECLMFEGVALEGGTIKGDVAVDNQPGTPIIDLRSNPPPEGLTGKPTTDLPTSVAEGEGVWTNQDEALACEVAEGGGLEAHPFWLLLKHASYEE